jgi:hypothetical protein
MTAIAASLQPRVVEKLDLVAVSERTIQISPFEDRRAAVRLIFAPRRALAQGDPREAAAHPLTDRGPKISIEPGRTMREQRGLRIEQRSQQRFRLGDRYRERLARFGEEPFEPVGALLFFDRRLLRRLPGRSLGGQASPGCRTRPRA